MAALVEIQAFGLREAARDLKAAGTKLPRQLGKRLKQAGELVAVDARQRASWSTRIPGSIRVTGGATSVSIKAGGPKAPHAAPYEGAAGQATFRHPVYGNRHAWRTQATRPYLRPAGDAKADACAELIAQALTDSFGAG